MKFNHVYAVISLVAFMCVKPAQAVELRLGTIAPTGHVWLAIADRIDQELDARPELDLQLSIFPNAQLGQESETMQQVETGLLDMAIFTASGLLTREEGLNGWFTPYLFNDVEAAGRARRTPAAQQMLANLGDAQMIGLGYVFAGMRQIISRDRSIETAADISGLKVRITPFPAAQTWWNAMGATPIPMPLSGVYQGLQTGVVDAIDIDLDATVSMSLQEVASNFALTNHMPWPGVIVVSSLVWDSLSAEQQEGLREVIEIAVDFGIEAQMQAEQDNLATISGSLAVHQIENGEDVFRVATEAFQAAFGEIDLVNQFQEQVRALD